MIMIVIMIIIIIGNTAPFESYTSLEDYARFVYSWELDLVFTSLDFSAVIFLQRKVISLASNPQPGGPSLSIYVPQEQGGPVIPPGTGFPFCRLLRLARLRWSILSSYTQEFSMSSSSN
jgi:hypothetical protein